MKKKMINMSYEPEADVLRIQASKRPIDYAKEVGNVIVHFDTYGIPVYFEILQASNFIRQASTLVSSSQRRVLAPAV